MTQIIVPARLGGVRSDDDPMTTEGTKMKNLFRAGMFLIVLHVPCLPVPAAGGDLRDSLQLESISSVRINLNPWGPQIGFEIEVAGDDPLLAPLAAVIRQAEPGGGHKCANAGAIRFCMKDGSVVGVGLLPSHTEGRYEFRLYDGDQYLEAYIVERKSLLVALEGLGVPMDDPAFTE
jgi:hypothetical protein